MLAQMYNWFTEGFETADLRTPRRCSLSEAADQNQRGIRYSRSGLLAALFSDDKVCYRLVDENSHVTGILSPVRIEAVG